MLGSLYFKDKDSTLDFHFCCGTPVLGLGLGIDFTFAWDNNNHKNNPHLNFVKGTVPGNEEQGVAIRDKG